MKKKVKKVRVSLVIAVISLLLLISILIIFLGLKNSELINLAPIKTPSLFCTGPYKEEIKQGCTSLTDPSYTCCIETSEGFNCYSQTAKKISCKNPDGIYKNYYYISSMKDQLFDEKLYPLYDSYITQRVRCKAGFPELYETNNIIKEYKKEYNKFLRKDQSCLVKLGNVVEKSSVFAGYSSNSVDGIKINHPTYAKESLHSSFSKYIDNPFKNNLKNGEHLSLRDETIRRIATRCEYETENGEIRYSYRWFTFSVTKSLVTNNSYGQQTKSTGTCTVYFKPKESIDGCPISHTIYKVAETNIQGADYNCYSLLDVIPGTYSKGELDNSGAFLEMDNGIVTKVMPIDETPQEPGTSIPFLAKYPGISGLLEN